MTLPTRRRHPSLGIAEQAVMDIVWAQGPISSEACRAALEQVWPMKESTVRTVLRRLQEKGFITHAQEGRAFFYEATEPRRNVAVRAVKNIIDRFCGGSAEELVLGMVASEVIAPKTLERLARRVSEARTQPARPTPRGKKV